MIGDDEILANAALPTRAMILRLAENLTCGDRNTSYGDPKDNMDHTAALWSAFLGLPITGAQVATCMALVKIARLRVSPDHQDSHVDAAAYMAIAYECAEPTTEKEQPVTHFLKCDQHNWVWTVDSNGPHWQCADCGSRKYA